MTTTTTNSQFAPGTMIFGDRLSELMEGATEIARFSFETYLTGLNTIITQQELVNEASRQWFSDIVTTEQKDSERLVASAASAGGELVEATAGSVKPARKARRRPMSRASKSALADALQSGPAKWTSDGYESLTAAEVTARLRQFSQNELDEVEAYEKAHQARDTVLHRIASLRAEEPMPGYDKLTVPEIRQRLTEGDGDLASRVREYERAHKSREGALQAADAQLGDS